MRAIRMLTAITLPSPRRAKQRKRGCALVKSANLCFNNGYRRAAKFRRATSAWIGFAAGTAVLLTWLATHDS